MVFNHCVVKTYKIWWAPNTNYWHSGLRGLTILIGVPHLFVQLLSTGNTFSIFRRARRCGFPLMQNFLPILIDLSSSIQLSFLTLPFLIRPCIVFIQNPLGDDIECVDLISCHHLLYRLKGRFALRKVFRVLCYLTYICTFIRTPISYSKRKVIQ